MKKLLIFIISVLVFTIVKSQGKFPIEPWSGNLKTLAYDSGARGSYYGFQFRHNFADTADLNAQPFIKYIPGFVALAADTLRKRNSTATKWDIIGGGSGGGIGTVTSFSSGNLSPLFTTTVSTASSTPSLLFSLSNSSAYKIFGRASGTGAPSYLTLDTNFIPSFSTYIRPLFSAGVGLSYNPVTGVFVADTTLLSTRLFSSHVAHDTLVANAVTIRNAQIGDTAFTNPSTNQYLWKSDVWGYGLLSANNTDTTKGAKLDTATVFPAIRATISSSGGTADGNYGNVQLNRNGAFKAAGSDSLNFGSSTLSVKGHASLTGNLYLPNSTSSVGSIYLNNLRWLGNGGDASGHTNIFGGQHTGSDTALDNNIGFGTNVLQKTNGRKAIAIGENAAQNVTGYDGGDGSSQFIAIGPGAMSLATGSHMDIMIGPDAGLHLTDTSIHNMGIGKSVWAQLRAGVGNAAFGYSVGANGTGFRGSWNTILGDDAFSSPTSGDNNTSAGAFALAGSTTGGNNSAFAYHALDGLTTGTNNTALGLYAGHNVTTGSFNTHIGSLAGGLDINASNEFVVNSDAAGALMHLIHGNSATHKIGFNITQAQSIAQPDYSLLMHGTSHFDSTVKIDDSLIIDIPSKGANKVLVSDANGAATWTNPAAIGSLTVGSTPIASGTTTKVLFDNGGILGEYTITGSGSVAMSASPTFTGDATVYNLVSSSYGSSFLKSSVGSTYPWVFDLSASFLDNQRGLVIRGSQAATKGNSLEIVDAFFTGLSAFDGTGKLGIGNVAPTEKLDVTGNVKFSGALMPNNTAGTSGYLLQSAGAGSPPTWVAQSTLAIPLSSITAATGTNSIDNLNRLQQWDWSTLAGIDGLKLNAASTLAASNGQILFNVQMSGANANSTQTTRTGYMANLHTGTAATNIVLQLDAQGGTNNVGLNVINGSSAFGNITPTAIVHIKAGTATAGTASLKLTDGTVNTIAEAGAREMQGGFYDTKVSGLRYALGGIIYDFKADSSNSGSSETDAYSYTLPANGLAADGEKITFNYTINLTDLTSTAQIKVKLDGQTIANTGALTVSATGAVVVSGWAIRTSSTTVRTSVNISSPGASTAIYTSQNDLTGLTLSSSFILKLTLQAGGGTPSTGDLVAKQGYVSWFGLAR